MRALLAVSLLLVLGSCTIPLGKAPRERAPLESAPDEPLVLHDLGLSCDQCRFSTDSSCSGLNGEGAALVAVAKGSQPTDELQECMQLSNGRQHCVVHQVYRFDDLKFMRRPTEFKPSDAFAASVRADSTSKTLALVAPDKRYVIVARRPDTATSARAQWNLAAACEVPATATFPTR